MLVSMSQAVTDVVGCFRTKAKLDPDVRRAARELLAIGDDLITAMEQESKFDSADDLNGWKAQHDIVDRLVLRYFDALTACRMASGWKNGRSAG